MAAIGVRYASQAHHSHDRFCLGAISVDGSSNGARPCRERGKLESL
ncbi:hypothetical protein FHS09_000596 [Microbulbifer rhizosphaerae]|uniref:Uncharacterized protein n=1 Tax=Microbulbifer rhizosphaerae TaxID=1562603 RepID=A0A7W4Z7I7_9GAMM|nr:hypothetical protein [Microbulbifer rhizosphaerae]